MRVNNINNINFGILDRSSIKKRPYGDYYSGFYKGNRIGVYDAHEFNQRLVYASSKDGSLIKMKLVQLRDGVRKVLRSSGRKH